MMLETIVHASVALRRRSTTATLLCLLAFALDSSSARAIAVGISVEPTIGETPEREWSFTIARPAAAIEEAFRISASAASATIDDDEEGLLFTSTRYFAPELDKYCIYPVVNAKTGGRLHTFASFHLSIFKTSARRRVAGLVLGQLVVEPQGDSTRLRFVSQCRSDSELGESQATSRGLFEKQLLDASLQRLGLNVDVPLPVEHETLTTFVEYRPVVERPLGPQVHPTRSKIPGQRADWTLVRASLGPGTSLSWSNVRAVAESMAHERGEKVHMDEAQRRASIGFTEFPDAPPESPQAWADSLQIQIRSLPGGDDEIVVKRRLVIPNPDNPTGWKSVPGSGAVERWILTRVLQAPEAGVLGSEPGTASNAASDLTPVAGGVIASPTADEGHPAAVAPGGDTPAAKTGFHCTVDQVLAMKEAGLSDQQIRASCHN